MGLLRCVGVPCVRVCAKWVGGCGRVWPVGGASRRARGEGEGVGECRRRVRVRGEGRPGWG